MRALTHFSIPIKGLENGLHTYQFKIDKAFFDNFENGLLSNGDFNVNLELDKKSNHIELQFDISGHLHTECDRCTANIELPLDGHHTLLVKYTAEEEKMDEEVWYITHDTSEINVSKIIYEFISLSCPLIKAYDCEYDEKPPCNQEVKSKLEKDDDEEVKGNNPLKDMLSNLDFNN